MPSKINRFGFDETKLPEKTVEGWLAARAKLANPVDRIAWDNVTYQGVPRGVWLIGLEET